MKRVLRMTTIPRSLTHHHRTVATNVSVPRNLTQQQQQQQQPSVHNHDERQSWEAAEIAARGSNTATLKYLQQISQAIDKVIQEKVTTKAANKSNLTKKEEDSGKQQMGEAWQAFENAYDNAKSCVSDVLEASSPGQWLEEMETAEEALSQAQAAYVDVLETCHCQGAKASRRREKAAMQIRQLRLQLDAVSSKITKRQSA